MNCLAENSDVKANSPWVLSFFIYSLFHTEFCRFDVSYNNIIVSISSPESDSELIAMNSAIVHFARLQETTSQYAFTLCHAVFPVLRLCVLLPPTSQYALTLCHAVFLVLRFRALLCPALRPPASQCAPGLKPVVFPSFVAHIMHLRLHVYDSSPDGQLSHPTTLS